MSSPATSVDALREAFARHFPSGGRPRLAGAPGRVNLIGEHIDYNGLPVLPMAIARHTRVMFRPRTDTAVRVVNVDPRYPPRSFFLSRDIEPHESGDWANYLKAACMAVTARHADLVGFDAVVDGSIPVAAGLSSSSALVVSAALALLSSNDLSWQPMPLAGDLARAERFVGTQGGGMDQAVCLGGLAHHAVRIDFDPVRVTPVPVSASWRFVVAHSLVPAEKSGAQQEVYNTRVRECRRALRLVTEFLGGITEPGYRPLVDTVPIGTLEETAAAALPADLRKRFLHVVREARRVNQAVRALQDEDMAAFGRLMIASHESLRDDYQVSCAELNQLVDLALDAGAAGARLTGAGFGGCVVALTHEQRIPAVAEALRRHFYGRRELPAPLDDLLFVATPADGARVERT